MNTLPYLRLARIDSWTKNAVVLIGVAAASVLSGVHASISEVLTALAVMCLASSANYVLNEYLDARTDAHHPIKKKRASVQYTLSLPAVVAEYAAFAISSLLLSQMLGGAASCVCAVYLLCGGLYNVRPVRLKDVAYADVLLESINYPLRVLLGWLCVLPELLPPSSIMIITWALGAFTMSMKRMAEFQLFRNREAAASYRRSYAQYGEHSLAICGFVYALLTIFSATTLLLKYKAELIITVPVLIALMAWYYLMGLRHELFIIYPERLMRNPVFMGLCAMLTLTGLLALNVSIPQLQLLLIPLSFQR